MRVSDATLAEVRERGFSLMEGFLAADELAAAQDALWKHFPRPEEYFADLLVPVPGFQERLDCLWSNVTPALYEFASEIDQGVEFRIGHRLSSPHRCDNGAGHLEHPLGDRAVGGDAIGALVDDAGRQEHELSFRGTQCGFAIDGIERQISLEQDGGIRKGGEKIWDESEAVLDLFQNRARRGRNLVAMNTRENQGGRIAHNVAPEEVREMWIYTIHADFVSRAAVWYIVLTRTI